MLPKLDILDDEIQAKQQVAEHYTELLCGSLSRERLLDTPYIDPHNQSAWAQYTIRVNDREAVQERLKEAGIPTAVHYPIPLNKQPAVQNDSKALPKGDEAAKTVISLPMSPSLPQGSEQLITEILTAH